MAKKFICNGMLGRLCKLLRTCGIDTSYSNAGIKILLQAKKEGRIILTKNARLRDRAGVCFVASDVPKRQLRNIIDTYKLGNNLKPFSRCIICNSKLAPVNKAAVKDRVPYYTYKNFEEFSACPNCHRVYWKGSHYEKMIDEINGMSK